MKKMGHLKTVILVTFGLILLATTFFFTAKKDVDNYVSGISNNVIVEDTWEMPEELKEISGIAFLEPNRIASVQDEDGIIFIYDLSTSKVEKTIEFGGSGDYEAITIHGSDAYVLRSDGTIFRVNDFMTKADTEIFESDFFSTKNDMESLFFDTSENRLLITSKAKDPVSNEYTGIYAVDPSTMQVQKDPVYKMTFEDEIFEEKRKKNAARSYAPSEVYRDPNTGDLLVLEATQPHLLIMHSNGDPKALHRLDSKVFPQPEGITFDAAGNMYISNEGNPATIHKVSIN